MPRADKADCSVTKALNIQPAEYPEHDYTKIKTFSEITGPSKKELLRSGNGKVPPLVPNDLAMLPAGAFILIGDRSPNFGGDLASTGYVMHIGRVIGTVSVSASDVERGALDVR